ncbi:SspB-related isopeptide-forming adhesin, partial [Streptococcus hyointestinalis]
KTIITTPSGSYTTVSNTPVYYTPGNDPKTPRNPGGDNPTPHDNLIQPTKDVVDDKGQSINGQSILPNTPLNYVAKQDFDQYQGMEASQAAIAKGFAYIDDYSDEALDGDSMTVKSITAKNGDDVSSLLQMYHVLSADTLDDKLKELVKQSGISPVGEFYMWVAKDPDSFYKAYVQKGLDVTYNLSFKVKQSFTEGDITNQTYQIDFGNGYYGNIVTNNLPPMVVHKVVKDKDGTNIDGQTVAIGDEISYELEGWVVPAGRGYDLYEYRFVDILDKEHDAYEDYQVTAKV